MLKSWFKKYQLTFKSPVLTSRGEMKVKNGYYLFVSDGAKTGTGECSYIEGLSIDDLEDYENALRMLCRHIETGNEEFLPDMNSFPSINFAWETAMADLAGGGKKLLYESDFTAGKDAIPINGLVWMGNKDEMLQQVGKKLVEGYKCIKIKVGAIDFSDEVALLDAIRQKFPRDKIEIRLDANGAFTRTNVFAKLETLSKYGIHSIEQPVKQNQLELMKEVCLNSPIPVALDEELIKLESVTKAELLSFLKPAYIILKPSLLGGFNNCTGWIELASSFGIGWWVTSALEGNVGLNAIAQWVYLQGSPLTQGLGTGELYTNNIPSPLYIQNACLNFNREGEWGEVE